MGSSAAFVGMVNDPFPAMVFVLLLSLHQGRSCGGTARIVSKPSRKFRAFDANLRRRPNGSLKAPGLWSYPTRRISRAGTMGVMFFLLRVAFWLSIVVVLLPSGPKTDPNAASVGTFEAIGAAQAAIKDARGFCEREPEACAVGSQRFRCSARKRRTARKCSTSSSRRVRSTTAPPVRRPNPAATP